MMYHLLSELYAITYDSEIAHNTKMMAIIMSTEKSINEVEGNAIDVSSTDL
jgi:hypothetical protein